jgi:deoxyhypusine synthase
VSNLFHSRVRPFSITNQLSAAEMVERMAGTAFQARNLAQAVHIWDRMLRDEVTIFFGLAGAMVPAGMRPVITYLIENRLIDCLVSTGANLFHDVYETLGKLHWQGVWTPAGPTPRASTSTCSGRPWHRSRRKRAS